MRRRLPLPLLLLALVQLVLSAPAVAAPTPWTRWSVEAGTDRGATVRSLDFTAPGVVYAGSEDDGIFTNGSAGLGEWDPDNGGLAGITGANNIRQVISKDGNLYAATSVGVFKKAVGGGNWAPHGQGAEPGRLNLPVQSLHFNSGSDVVAAVAAASPGVYRSGDGGEHWTKATGIPTSTSVFFLHSTGGVLFAAADNGVYRSLDGGSTWTLRSDGLPFANALRLAGGLNNLFVATNSGVFRSTNGGETWTDSNGFGPTALGNTSALGMLAAPGGFGGGRFLVATGSGVWASRDNGVNWGEMSETSAGGEPAMGDRKVWTLGFNPVVAPGGLLAGTQGFGVYRLPFQPVTAGGTAPAVTAPNPLRVGMTITGTRGSWNGAAPFFFAYLWVRCTAGQAPEDCQSTGDTGLTHTVEPDDINKYLRLRVTATGIVPPDPDPEFSAPTTQVMAAQGNPPNAPGGSYPRILGPDNQSATQKSYDWGTELHVDAGTWPAGTSLTYQWLRCTQGCGEIQGATGTKYVTTPADAERTLKVEVTGTLNNNSTTVTGGPTFIITERKPVNVDAPRVVGDPYVGSTLDSTGGSWQGRNITYFRSWQACDADGTGCNTIPSEVGQQYTINKIWLGKRLRVRIQVSNAAGSQDDREAFSDMTPVITVPPVDQPPVVEQPPVVTPPVVTPPVVTPPGVKPLGKPALVRPRKLRVGATLKAPRIAGATKVRYQWLRNGKAIKGAKKRAYRIRRKDRGKRLACRMSFVLDGVPRKVTTKAVRVPRKRR